MPDMSRPVEIEEVTNRLWVHPLSHALAQKLAPTPVSANMLSRLGAVFGLGAGVAYYFGASPWAALTGFFLMFAWHVLDGADGKLARIKGEVSAFGRLLDGICDYTTFGAVYIAMALAAQQQGMEAWVWGLGVLATLAHAVQAAAYEARREIYISYLRGDRPATIPPRSIGVLESFYALMQRLSRPKDVGLDMALARARKNPAVSPQQIDDLLRHQASKITRRWGWLSANNRSIAIFAFHIFGWPIGFFYYEAVFLSVIYLLLRHWEMCQNINLAAQFESLASTPPRD